MSLKISIEARDGAGKQTEKWTGTLLSNVSDGGNFISTNGQEVRIDLDPAESSTDQPVIAVESEIFKGHLRVPETKDPYYGDRRRKVYVSKKTGRGAQCLTSDTKLVVELSEENL